MPDTSSTYDIELLGFPEVDPRKAVGALSKAFRIDGQKAQRLIDRVPVTVRVNAKRPDAERYTKALLAIGADVRVMGPEGDRVFRAAESQYVTGTWTGTHVSSPSSSGAAVLKRQRSRDLSAVSRVHCPRCGLDQPPSNSCVRCGIDFDKYAGSGRAPSVESPTREAASRPTPSGRGPTYSTPSSVRAEHTGSYHRSAPDSLYTLSPEDDDGLFVSRRPSVDPGRILREAGDVLAAHIPVARPRSATFDAPSVALRKPTGGAAEHRRGSSDVGFWDKIGHGYLFALQGASYQWLALMAVLGAVSYGVLRLMSRAPVIFVQLAGLFVLIVLFSAFLAAQWRFFHATFHSAVADRNYPVPPVTGIEDFRSEFVLPGELLCVAALILWAPFLYIVFRAFDSAIMPSPSAVMLTSLLPLIYWPMGMAWVSASGRLTEIFIVTGIVKGMVVGGLEYAFIVAIGVLAFFGVDRFVSAVGDVSFLSWALLYVALGYTSGVQGYLLGRLLRRRPHMIEGTEVEEA